MYPFRLFRHWLVPVRYVLSAVCTVGYLLVRRPRSVVATNPPVFPYAVYVRNEPADIARGIQFAVDRVTQLATVAPEAVAAQRRRWQAQLAALRGRLGLPDVADPAAQVPAAVGRMEG